jgi:hypothetical protein
LIGFFFIVAKTKSSSPHSYYQEAQAGKAMAGFAKMVPGN